MFDLLPYVQSNLSESDKGTVGPVYHGTNKGFSEFRGDLIWFTTDQDDAADYNSGRTIEAYLHLGKTADLDNRKVKALLSRAGIDPDDLFTLTEEGSKVSNILKGAGFNSAKVYRGDVGRGVYHYAVFSPEQVKIQPSAAVSESCSESDSPPGSVMAYRYTSRDGTGIINHGAYDLDRLDDDDATELEEWLNYGLQHPRDVPSSQVFLFTEEGVKRNAAGLRLLQKAARRGFVKHTYRVIGEPSWESRDGQIAVSPSQLSEVEP